MKRSLSTAASIVGPLVLVTLIWTFQVRAIPIQSPTTWRDDFDDDSGLDALVDTEVVTATGHLTLARSAANPGNGMALSSPSGAYSMPGHIHHRARFPDRRTDRRA